MNQEIKLTPQMDDETKIILTFLNMSKNRMKVFKTFKENEILTAKQISEINQININTVSKSLKQLKEKELLTVLNPNVRANRLNKITSKGHKIIKYLNYWK